ncbi:PH domain-containing protein [Anaerolinea sp.]|uniref:PH domain-containing protein n=1 Tax=Anaerolinea sp. TaxID=1872519 RepID=UPI002ACDCDBB|nr:PH domain-containing protein [Anaerolinea sp.]
MLHGIFGNATEISPKELSKELEPILIEGETILKAFKVIRDLFVFTDKRLILVDKQGVTGKKVKYHSIPYRSITHFSVETPGTFDLDAELKIYISGIPAPIEREFKRGTDIIAIQKAIASFIMR